MTFEDEDYDEAALEKHERRITRCSDAGCRARIIFLKTLGGSTMPVDADTVEPSDEYFEAKRHQSHFGTCPAAKRFSKRRR
jgi:hypothetical protein